jgi:N-sulfoglucosamine sulfohydrolase
MRSVETRRYGYIFNPWADGQRRFRTATQGMQTSKRMPQLAETDAAIAGRLRFFDYRTVEEFYDYQQDPDALHNLIDDPRYRKEIDRLRAILDAWMTETKDHCLEAFRGRASPEVLEAYMRRVQDASDERRGKRRKQKQAPDA